MATGYWILIGICQIRSKDSETNMRMLKYGKSHFQLRYSAKLHKNTTKVCGIEKIKKKKKKTTIYYRASE